MKAKQHMRRLRHHHIIVQQNNRLWQWQEERESISRIRMSYRPGDPVYHTYETAVSPRPVLSTQLKHFESAKKKRKQYAFLYPKDFRVSEYPLGPCVMILLAKGKSLCC